MRTTLVIALALIVVSAGYPRETLPVARSIELALTPDGERIGVLLAGSPIKVLEERGEWSRVSVEGWIRSHEIPAPEQAAVTEAMLPPPEAASGSGGHDASLGGAVFIIAAGNTVVGSRIAVRLLSDPDAALQQVGDIRQACDAKREGLEQEAAMLADKADRALKTIESTSQAFEAYDEAKRQRARKLREIKAVNEDCLAKTEAEIERHAAASVLTSADGRYRFDGIAPGAYLLIAALQADGTRHEWSIRVDLTEGMERNLDLTTANRTRLEAPHQLR